MPRVFAAEDVGWTPDKVLGMSRWLDENFTSYQFDAAIPKLKVHGRRCCAWGESRSNCRVRGVLPHSSTPLVLAM